MKKLFLTTLCLFAVCFSFAQTNETNIEHHLKFKGIPIDGTPFEFGEKLKETGFSYRETDSDGYRWYKGNFAGYNNCEIVVKANNNIVYEVVAIFPESYSWNHLYNNYSSLKRMLTTKYGEPWLNKEKFENTPSYVKIENDDAKFKEVQKGNCKYVVAFTSEKDGIGDIVLEIKKSCCISLFYTDYRNKIKKDASAINDL